MQIGDQVETKMIRLAGILRRCKPRIAGLQAPAGGMILLICVLPLLSRAAAQDLPPPPIPVDPTPLIQLLSPMEKAQLSEADNHKKAVDFYLKIADVHLEFARSSIKNGDYRTSERELDIYNKAMSEAMKATTAHQDGRRNLAKKIEQNLYKQIKTLEGVELLFPLERQEFATAALKQAKQLRVQALNTAFASGETLKDPNEEKKPKSESPNKDGSTGGLPRFASPAMIWSGVRGYAGSLELRGLPAAYARRPERMQSAQAPSDYLTEEEDDKVREAQSADARAKVFMRIADRRIRLITGGAPPPKAEKAPFWKKGGKNSEEEEREWGVLKTTSRTDLLRHYSRAIEECMAKIEDAYERNPKSTALPKALATLREATERHLQALKSIAAQVTDEEEMRALRDAIEQAELANKGAREGIKAK